MNVSVELGSWAWHATEGEENTLGDWLLGSSGEVNSLGGVVWPMVDEIVSTSRDSG